MDWGSRNQQQEIPGITRNNDIVYELNGNRINVYNDETV